MNLDVVLPTILTILGVVYFPVRYAQLRHLPKSEHAADLAFFFAWLPVAFGVMIYFVAMALRALHG
jgi:hypothetical protein